MQMDAVYVRIGDERISAVDFLKRVIKEAIREEQNDENVRNL